MSYSISISIEERYGILVVLNAVQKAGIEDWKGIHSMKKTLEIVQSDIEEYGITISETGVMSFDSSKKELRKDFEISFMEMQILQNLFKTLDQRKSIHKDILPAALRLVELDLLAPWNGSA